MYITFVYRFNTVLYLIVMLMVIHLLEFFTLARTQHPSNIFENRVYYVIRHQKKNESNQFLNKLVFLLHTIK